MPSNPLGNAGINLGGDPPKAKASKAKKPKAAPAPVQAAPEEEAKKRFTVPLRPVLIEAMRDASVATGRTMADIAEDALDLYLEGIAKGLGGTIPKRPSGRKRLRVGRPVKGRE